MFDCSYTQLRQQDNLIFYDLLIIQEKSDPSVWQNWMPEAITWKTPGDITIYSGRILEKIAGKTTAEVDWEILVGIYWRIPG